MSLYTTTSLAEKIGATMREIDYWVSSGYVKPTPIVGEDNRRSPGTGKARIWDERDAETALWFARLVRLGMKPSKVEDTAEKLARGQSAYLPGGIEIRQTPRSSGSES